jgi:hypothetical protein
MLHYVPQPTERPTNEIDYYRRRAIQEQAAAQRAACPTARMIHDELAAAYRFRVSILSDAWNVAGTAIALQRLSRERPLEAVS